MILYKHQIEILDSMSAEQIRDYLEGRQNGKWRLIDDEQVIRSEKTIDDFCDEFYYNYGLEDYNITQDQLDAFFEVSKIDIKDMGHDFYDNYEQYGSENYGEAFDATTDRHIPDWDGNDDLGEYILEVIKQHTRDSKLADLLD